MTTQSLVYEVTAFQLFEVQSKDVTQDWSL